MAPFRWPKTEHDLMLCKEVAARNPQSPNDWEKIAETSSPEKPVRIKCQGCRERLERLLQKHEEDKKALKR